MAVESGSVTLSVSGSCGGIDFGDSQLWSSNVTTSGKHNANMLYYVVTNNHDDLPFVVSLPQECGYSRLRFHHS